MQNPEQLNDRGPQQQQASEQDAGQDSGQLDEDSGGHVTSRDGQSHGEERLDCHDVRSPSRYEAAKRAIRLWWDIDFSQLRKIEFQTRVAKIIKGGVRIRRRQTTLVLTMETWAFEECQDSYVWRILWLLSANTYGITSVLEARADSDGMSGNPNELGFGQIVPLALLLLPIISATQSISGKLAVVFIGPGLTFTKDYRSKASHHSQPTEDCELSLLRETQSPIMAEQGNQALPTPSLEDEVARYARAAKAFIYGHAMFMLVFGAVLGWGLASGDCPFWLSWLLLIILSFIVMRRSVALIYNILIVYKLQRRPDIHESSFDAARMIMVAEAVELQGEDGTGDEEAAEETTGV